MKKIALSGLALALGMTAGAASADPAESVTYAFYNSGGAVVGTRTVSCDGSETLSGEQTADEVETDRQTCDGAARDTDPEVSNGPPT